MDAETYRRTNYKPLTLCFFADLLKNIHEIYGLMSLPQLRALSTAAGESRAMNSLGDHRERFVSDFQRHVARAFP